MLPTRVTALLACILSVAVAGADETPAPSFGQQVTTAALEHRLRLNFADGVFSGPAWERLVDAGHRSQFFLVGEEHGIAENPQLVGQLFTELSSHGYTKLAIEISPTMASLVDEALAGDGLDGLRRLYAQPGGEPAFYGMAEEALMLARVRAAVSPGEPVLWGTDYEVAGDRPLLKLLEAADKPAAAENALRELVSASAASWAQYEEQHSPRFIFSFAGDPALVAAVREAWPDPDPRSALILDTLEKTLTINQLWVQGQAWASNEARAALQRENFLRHWRAERQAGRTPKVLAKYGASHMVRGRSQTAVFDLGTLLPEIAALEGAQAYSVMVIPGAGTRIAGLNPATWTYEPNPAEGSYLTGLAPLIEAAHDDAFTLIDLAALRPVVGMNRRDLDEELFRIVHGFDALLVMSGSTPSSNF